MLVSYVNPNNYFARTSWDGAYYLLPYAESNFANNAFTAHKTADGEWYFSVVETTTWEEDGETYTEESTKYMGFHEPANDNLNARLGAPAYFKVEDAGSDGFYRLRAAGNHGNPGVEGICLHLNAGGQYLVISESSCGWFPDVYGGVEYETDDAGERYLKLDEEGRCIPLDRSSELWAFANPDELPAFKNKLELYSVLQNLEKTIANLTDDTFKPGFQGGLDAALVYYNQDELSDEDLAAAKAILQAKQSLYEQILQAQQTLASEPDADLQAAVDAAIVAFNTKNTVEELTAAQEALAAAQTRHDMGQGDLTRMGQNMSFEDLSSQNGNTTTGVAAAPTGWNLYVNGTQVVTEDEVRAAGLNAWAGINGDGTGAKDGNLIYGIWNSGIPTIELSQTLENLETGTYLVQAAMMVGANGNGSRRTTQRIFGNLNAKYFSAEGDYNLNELDQSEAYAFEGLVEPTTDTELQEMSVRAFVFDGSLTFGLRTDGNIAAANRTSSNGAGGDGWFKVDNFRVQSLGYVQDDALAIYQHFYDALDNSLNNQMELTIYNKVEALLASTKCDQNSSAEEIVAAIKSLRDIYPEVKASIDVYNKLAEAIEQAYENYEEYQFYEGADDFYAVIMEAQDMYDVGEANADEVNAMIKALDDAFQELKMGGVAVGVDVTDIIKNPGFEDLSAQNNRESSGSENPPAGWNLYLNGEQQITAPSLGWCAINNGDDISGYGVYDEDGNPVTVQYVEGSHLWGIWNGNIPEVELSQTITGLPAGTYVLSANVMVEYQWAGNCLTTQRIFANDYVEMFGTEEDHAVNLPTDAMAAKTFDEEHDCDLKKLTYAGYTCTADDPFTHTLRPMEVRFGVSEEGTAVIGFRTSNVGPDGISDTSTGHGWFKVDNFRLFYESEEIPSAIKGISETTTIGKQAVFGIDGRQKSHLERGLNILRTTDANGKTTVSKVIVK
ncbi:MAG: hypothetical protein K6C10_09735 [Prevotella sp.]|nr:hypothetical protein [Prevotella sp.]